MKTIRILFSLAITITLSYGNLFAQDGTGIGSGGLTLKFTQDTATQFGDAVGGGQDSFGGSEIDSVWGDVSPAGVLSLSIAGNLEGNFNKLFLFIDGVAGGENVGLDDNVDGGFNEVNSFVGMTWDAGFTPDHGIRFEVGGGFLGINEFDLLDNTGAQVITGAGPENLPLNAATGGSLTVGWDNSNIVGVDGTSAANAATATTGFELLIDLPTLLGGPLTQNIRVGGFVTSGGGDFLSNQVIGGVGGAGNLGDPTIVDFTAIAGDQFVTFEVEGVALPGDFDGDGDVDDNDIDLLSAQIGQPASADPRMDINNDTNIDLADHDLHITTLVQDANGTGALIGDLNFDGDVDVSEIQIVNGQVINNGDASTLLASLGQGSGQLYSDGDLNGDGDVDVSQIVVVNGQVNNLGDASRLLANLGQTTAGPPAAAAVPEPGAI